MKFKTNGLVFDQYNSNTLFKLALFLIGVILLSISSKVSIPFYPVPMTFQTLVVYLISVSMGMVGFYSTLAYVLLGLLGLPIFAAGGGLGYIFSPTFGFLYGMVIASFFIAFFSNYFFNKGVIYNFFMIFLGAFIIFLFGIMHLSFFTGFQKAIIFGLIPFIYSELLKIFLGVALSSLIIRKK